MKDKNGKIIRKFTIGQYVRNTYNGKTGKITAYDLNPEVYSVFLDESGFALWGELEMESAEMPPKR